MCPPDQFDSTRLYRKDLDEWYRQNATQEKNLNSRLQKISDEFCKSYLTAQEILHLKREIKDEITNIIGEQLNIPEDIFTEIFRFLRFENRISFVVGLFSQEQPLQLPPVHPSMAKTVTSLFSAGFESLQLCDLDKFDQMELLVLPFGGTVTDGKLPPRLTHLEMFAKNFSEFPDLTSIPLRKLSLFISDLPENLSVKLPNTLMSISLPVTSCFNGAMTSARPEPIKNLHETAIQILHYSSLYDPFDEKNPLISVDHLPKNLLGLAIFSLELKSLSDLSSTIIQHLRLQCPSLTLIQGLPESIRQIYVKSDALTSWPDLPRLIDKLGSNNIKLDCPNLAGYTTEKFKGLWLEVHHDEILPSLLADRINSATGSSDLCQGNKVVGKTVEAQVGNSGRSLEPFYHNPQIPW